MNKLCDFPSQLVPTIPPSLLRHCKVYPEGVSSDNKTNNSTQDFLEFDKDYKSKHSRVTVEHMKELFCTEHSHSCKDSVTVVCDLEEM